jgi:hypothetical protein
LNLRSLPVPVFGIEMLTNNLQGFMPLQSGHSIMFSLCFLPLSHRMVSSL